MIEVLNWYADHPVLGTIALILVSGAAVNLARVVLTVARGR